MLVLIKCNIYVYFFVGMACNNPEYIGRAGY